MTVTARRLLDELEQSQRPTRATLELKLASLQAAPVKPSPRARYNLACFVAPTDPSDCIDLLGRSTPRRSGVLWPDRDPSLRSVRVGSEGANFRRVVRRGRDSVHQTTELARLDAIGSVGADLLDRVGIENPQQLLAAAGGAARRSDLAKSLGYQGATVLRWAQLCELALSLGSPEVLPPGMSSEPLTPAPAWTKLDLPTRLDAANLLSLSGIEHRTTLASWKTEPESLARRMIVVNCATNAFVWPTRQMPRRVLRRPNFLERLFGVVVPATVPPKARPRDWIAWWTSTAATVRGSWIEVDSSPPPSDPDAADLGETEREPEESID